MAPLLSIEGVGKAFHTRGKQVVALDDISLGVEDRAHLLRWRPTEETTTKRDVF